MGTFMVVGVVSMAVVIGVVSTLVTYFALRRLGRFRNALSLDELDALYDDHDDDTTATNINVPIPGPGARSASESDSPLAPCSYNTIDVHVQVHVAKHTQAPSLQ